MSPIKSALGSLGNSPSLGATDRISHTTSSEFFFFTVFMDFLKTWWFSKNIKSSKITFFFFFQLHSFSNSKPYIFSHTLGVGGRGRTTIYILYDYWVCMVAANNSSAELLLDHWVCIVAANNSSTELLLDYWVCIVAANNSSVELLLDYWDCIVAANNSSAELLLVQSCRSNCDMYHYFYKRCSYNLSILIHATKNTND